MLVLRPRGFKFISFVSFEAAVCGVVKDILSSLMTPRKYSLNVNNQPTHCSRSLNLKEAFGEGSNYSRAVKNAIHDRSFYIIYSLICQQYSFPHESIKRH